MGHVFANITLLNSVDDILAQQEDIPLVEIDVIINPLTRQLTVHPYRPHRAQMKVKYHNSINMLLK